jgi:hypothetical protein
VTLGEFVQDLRRRYSARVIDTWLQEFGYKGASDVDPLLLAVASRSDRLERELDAHGKRLADRAKMQRAVVGRAGVLR